MFPLLFLLFEHQNVFFLLYIFLRYLMQVTVYVNKVGPYYNPHETYHYYELPVCRPEKVEHKSLTLGEILDGDR